MFASQATFKKTLAPFGMERTFEFDDEEGSRSVEPEAEAAFTVVPLRYVYEPESVVDDLIQNPALGFREMGTTASLLGTEP